MLQFFFKTIYGLVQLLVILVVMAQTGVVAYICIKEKPVYELTANHLRFKKRINIQVNTKVPISSEIDTVFEIPVKKSVMFNLPIQGKINVSLDEPFVIPVKGPIQVDLDHGFRIKKEIGIKTSLTIDQAVKTELFGVETLIPVKATVPIDLNLPFDEIIRIDDNFSLVATAPLTCQIKHDIVVPLNFMAKTAFEINETIPIPIKTEVKTGIKLMGDLPCYLYLDIFWDKTKGFSFEHSIQFE
jgi:hypothetical protein